MKDAMTTKSKENTLKILEEHYKAVKEQKDAWNFFLDTAEYVKFVQNNSQFAESIGKLKEQQKRAYEVFQKIDIKVVKELESAAKTITETIKRANINLEPVNRVIQELQQYNTGSILSSMSKAYKLDAYLFDIARHLKANGFENTIQRFVDEQKKIKNIYENFTFSPTLPLRDEAERELEMKRETEIWGAWEIFPFISRIFFDEVNLEKELVEAKNHNDKMAKWALMNYIGVRTELGTMRARKKSDSELVFFKVSDFKNKLDRIHKYLITELLSDKLNEKEADEEELLEKNGNFLKSIHLATKSLEPNDVIFLVLDEHFDIPIRCNVNNNKGETAYIKKLYDIAYYCDVPGKKVNYDKKLADNINNGLFKKRLVKKYMRTNKFNKPTLVQKSEDKNYLVLKNELPIKPILIKNIPFQHQSLYR